VSGVLLVVKIELEITPLREKGGVLRLKDGQLVWPWGV
jgi:hypothetical protein